MNNQQKPHNFSKWFAVLFLVVALVGFLDASYLTIQHYRGLPPACSLLEGCEVVTTSEYSVIAGIPTALFGVIFYLVLVILTVAYVESQNPKLLHYAAMLSPLGFAASLFFVYLQLFVINAVCIYCMASAATSTTLFVLGLVILKNKNYMQINNDVL